MHVRNWRAKRAGGRITVYGEGDHGGAVRLVGVDTVELRAGKIVAVDKTGAEHILASE